MFVTLGMFMFVDLNNTADKIGVILAILSGIFYSFYVVYMYRSKLDEMDYKTYVLSYDYYEYRHIYFRFDN